MNNFSIDQIENVLDMIEYECPSETFSELYEFEYECKKFANCFECWLHVVRCYQNEQMLKSMNDSESEDK